MSFIRKIALGATSVATVGALVLGGGLAAHADPQPPPYSAPWKSVNIAGSDTIDALTDALASLPKAPYNNIGNWNAVPVPPATDAITTSASGNTLWQRPNGSTAGLRALSSAADTTGAFTWLKNGAAIDLATSDLQVARSSSTSPWLTSGPLTHIPFAVDGVSYVTKSGSGLPTNLPLGSATDAPTAVTLHNIFAKKITVLNGVTLTPRLPQGNSGTRSFWISALGLTTAEANALPSTDANGTAIQENSGVHVITNGDILPYSVGAWIAQGNAAGIAADYGVTVPHGRGSAALGSINGKSPVTSGGALNSNTFPVLRPVFYVVPTASLSNVVINDLFVGGSSAVITATNPNDPSRSTIEDLGFGKFTTKTLNGVSYTAGQTTKKTNFYS